MFFLQMSGFPGSGKSTLARVIAKNTGAVIIDHDIVKSAFLQSCEGAIDTKAAGRISYDIEWALIEFHLSQGHSVILDSPCFYVEMLDKGMSRSRKYGAKYKYIECYLNDAEEIDRRLKSRERMLSQIQQVLDDEVSEEYFKKWIDNSKRPSDSVYLTVDSAQPLESYIDEVMNYICKN